MKIRKKLKKFINSGKELNENKILEKLSKYELISFDLFDTLLKRNIDFPYQVFELMELELKTKFPNFASNRRKAELKARETCNDEEVTLEEIYDNYENLDKKGKNYLMNKEMEYEESIIVINNTIFNIYNKLVQYGKKIIITTDTYLPEKFIEKLLNDNNISQYENLYVSSKLKKTKRSGSLYKYILECEHINAKNIIHIGDSFKADFKSAIKNKLNAIHIPTYESKKVYQINNKKDILEINYLNNYLKNCSMTSNDYFKFGYEKFGMFLYGYTKWLYEKLEKNDIKKVYFFSRDGQLMKLAFDIYNKNSSIKSYYLEVSRRSLRVPILWLDCSLETILKNLSAAKLISLNAFFKGVGLDINNYKDEIDMCGLSLNAILEYKQLSTNLNFLKLFKLIKKDIIDNSKKEYKNLVEYLEEQNINGKFAVVDIGWSGGMQNYLETVLEKMSTKSDVFGYYIGVTSNYVDKSKKNQKLEGYLFDFKNNKNESEYKSEGYIGLFESLFLEQDGSVKNYALNEKKQIVAVRYPYEYEVDGEKTIDYINIKKIQSGALEFIKQFSKCKITDLLNFNVNDLYEGVRKSGECPSMYDIKLFADFKFYDDTISYLAKPKKLYHYIFSPKLLISDFLNCRWKIGFLKRLLKLPLPYKRIYKLLKKLK